MKKRSIQRGVTAILVALLVAGLVPLLARAESWTGATVQSNGQTIPAPVYGNISGSKIKLDWSTTGTSGIYQLEAKAYYSTAICEINLDVKFDKNVLEMCTSSGTVPLDLMNCYERPLLGADWPGFAYPTRSITHTTSGWADNTWTYDGDYPPSAPWSNNDGCFSIFYFTQNRVNTRFNPEGVQQNFNYDELLQPTNGLSLGKVFFKFKPGKSTADLNTNTFTRETRATDWYSKMYTNYYVSTANRKISATGSDIWALYSKSATSLPLPGGDYIFEDIERCRYAIDFQVATADSASKAIEHTELGAIAQVPTEPTTTAPTTTPTAPTTTTTAPTTTTAAPTTTTTAAPTTTTAAQTTTTTAPTTTTAAPTTTTTAPTTAAQTTTTTAAPTTTTIALTKTTITPTTTTTAPTTTTTAPTTTDTEATTTQPIPTPPPVKGIFGTNARWHGAWWHYVLFFVGFGWLWMWL